MSILLEFISLEKFCVLLWLQMNTAFIPQKFTYIYHISYIYLLSIIWNNYATTKNMLKIECSMLMHSSRIQKLLIIQ